MWTFGVGGRPFEACLAVCGSDDSVDGVGCGEPDSPRRCPDRSRCRRGGALGPSPRIESLSDLRENENIVSFNLK